MPRVLEYPKIESNGLTKSVSNVTIGIANRSHYAIKGLRSA